MMFDWKAADWIKFGRDLLTHGMRNGCFTRKIVAPQLLEMPLLKSVLECNKDLVIEGVRNQVHLCGVPVKFTDKLKGNFLFVLESIEKTEKPPIGPLGGGTPIAGQPAMLSERKVS